MSSRPSVSQRGPPSGRAAHCQTLGPPALSPDKRDSEHLPPPPPTAAKIFFPEDLPDPKIQAGFDSLLKWHVDRSSKVPSLDFHQQQYRREAEDPHQSSSSSSSEVHHLLVSIPAIHLAARVPVELYFCLYSVQNQRFVSEEWVVSLDAKGQPGNPDAQSYRFLFLNLTPTEILKGDLRILCRIYRIGSVITSSMTTSTGLPARPELEKPFRRPWGVCVLSLPYRFEHRKTLTEPPAPVYQVNPAHEKDWKLIPQIVAEHGRGVEQLKNSPVTRAAYAEGLQTEITTFVCDIADLPPQLWEDQKSLFVERTGVHMIRCNETRERLYVSVLSGDFQSGGKKFLTKSIRFFMEVRDNSTYRPYRCIGRGFGPNAAITDRYHGTLLYHTNEPVWNERLCVHLDDIPLSSCHLYFEFSYASNRDQETSFCFGAVKLGAGQKGNLIIRDRLLKLQTFKYSNRELSKNRNYLQFDVATRESRTTSDTFHVTTTLWSNFYTPDNDLATLLCWNHTELGVPLYSPEELSNAAYNITKKPFNTDITNYLLPLLKAILGIVSSHKFQRPHRNRHSPQLSISVSDGFSAMARSPGANRTSSPQEEALHVAHYTLCYLIAQISTSETLPFVSRLAQLKSVADHFLEKEFSYPTAYTSMMKNFHSLLLFICDERTLTQSRLDQEPRYRQTLNLCAGLSLFFRIAVRSFQLHCQELQENDDSEGLAAAELDFGSSVVEVLRLLSRVVAHHKTYWVLDIAKSTFSQFPETLKALEPLCDPSPFSGNPVIPTQRLVEVTCQMVDRVPQDSSDRVLPALQVLIQLASEGRAVRPEFEAWHKPFLAVCLLQACKHLSYLPPDDLPGPEEPILARFTSFDKVRKLRSVDFIPDPPSNITQRLLIVRLLRLLLPALFNTPVSPPELPRVDAEDDTVSEPSQTPSPAEAALSDRELWEKVVERWDGREAAHFDSVPDVQEEDPSSPSSSSRDALVHPNDKPGLESPPRPTLPGLSLLFDQPAQGAGPGDPTLPPTGADQIRSGVEPEVDLHRQGSQAEGDRQFEGEEEDGDEEDGEGEDGDDDLGADASLSPIPSPSPSPTKTKTLSVLHGSPSQLAERSARLRQALSFLTCPWVRAIHPTSGKTYYYHRETAEITEEVPLTYFPSFYTGAWQAHDRKTGKLVLSSEDAEKTEKLFWYNTRSGRYSLAQPPVMTLVEERIGTLVAAEVHTSSLLQSELLSWLQQSSHQLAQAMRTWSIPATQIQFWILRLRLRQRSVMEDQRRLNLSEHQRNILDLPDPEWEIPSEDSIPGFRLRLLPALLQWLRILLYTRDRGRFRAEVVDRIRDESITSLVGPCQDDPELRVRVVTDTVFQDTVSVFCSSFYDHMDETDWLRLLSYLRSAQSDPSSPYFLDSGEYGEEEEEGSLSDGGNSNFQNLPCLDADLYPTDRVPRIGAADQPHSQQQQQHQGESPGRDDGGAVPAGSLDSLPHFLLSLIDVHRRLIRQSVFPSTWIMLRMKEVTAAVTNLQRLRIPFLQDYLVQHSQRSPGFHHELWCAYLHAHFQILQCWTLGNTTTAATQKYIRDRFPDLRLIVATHLLDVCHILGTYFTYNLGSGSVELVPQIPGQATSPRPNIILPIVQLANSPKPEVRESMRRLYFKLMYSEFEFRGTRNHFHRLESNTIDAVVSVVKQNRAASSGSPEHAVALDVSLNFFNKFMGRSVQGHPNRILRRTAHKFLKEVNDLFGYIFALESLPEQDPLYEDERAEACINLIRYLKKSRKEELYRKYLQYLCDLHRSFGNWPELGHTLLLSQHDLSWTADRFSSHRSSGRDAVVYGDSDPNEKLKIGEEAIRAFDQVKLWEMSVKVLQEQCLAYETVLFDFRALAETLRRQGEYFVRIAEGQRIFSAYYLVAFYGDGFADEIKTQRKLQELSLSTDNLSVLVELDGSEDQEEKDAVSEGQDDGEEGEKEEESETRQDSDADLPLRTLVPAPPAIKVSSSLDNLSLVRRIHTSKPLPTTPCDGPVTEYIYRSRYGESGKEFMEKIQRKFPNAVVENDNYPMTPEKLEKILRRSKLDLSQLEYIQVTTVEAHHVDSPRQSSLEAPRKIREYYNFNDVSHFSYTYKAKPREEPIGAEPHEFRDLWLHRVELTTSHAMPNLQRRFPVRSRREHLLSPIQNALESIRAKNEEIKAMIRDIREAQKLDRPINADPFSMLLTGVIDAAVQGGVEKYREAFFDGTYIRAFPEHRPLLRSFRRELARQLHLLKFGLQSFGEVCGPQLAPLHEHLMRTYDKMAQSMKALVGGRGISQRRSKALTSLTGIGGSTSHRSTAGDESTYHSLRTPSGRERRSIFHLLK